MTWWDNLTLLLPPLLSGLWVTVQIFFSAAFFGLLLASVFALLQVSEWTPFRWIARLYIEVFRGTSVLVQLFWFYFALPLIGVDLSAFSVGVLALSLNTGAYGAEIIRKSIESVPRGQREACIALNMSPYVAMKRVIFPQAIIRVLPPLSTLMIELLKGTALASLITIHDLTFQAQMLRTATLQTQLIFGLVLLLYFLVAQIVAFFFRKLEEKLGFET